MTFIYSYLVRCQWWALIACLLLAASARAQAPGWDLAASGSLTQPGGTSIVRATAADASGNLLVAGSFSGQVTFGSITLTSAGGTDLFVAKYVPATGTWAWAQRGGGTGNDYGYGVALSGPSVYVTGYIFNSLANTNAVAFGGPSPATSMVAQYGATYTASQDIVLAKYTDNGTSATFGWSQVAGGKADDLGQGVAVNGTSVYLTGILTNSDFNYYQAVFGGAGTTAGTVAQYGATNAPGPDLVVAKYTDNGATATFGWAQVGGGTYHDEGSAIAVSGSNVYVTGSIYNDKTNSQGVLFGGTGTTLGTAVQYGASTAPYYSDLVVAKYTDNGNSATLGWTQVAGGSDADYGRGIAASGNNVYVTGSINNDWTNSRGLTFGGTRATPGTAVQVGASGTATNDIVLAKYTDNGTAAAFGWAHVGGGYGIDEGYAVAVSGTTVYIATTIGNNSTNGSNVYFGGTGTVTGIYAQYGTTFTGSLDLVVGKYTDNGASGTFNWTEVAGGSNNEYGYGIAVTSTGVYVGGVVNGLLTPAYKNGNAIRFGTATGSPLLGTIGQRATLAQISPAGVWQSVVASANGGSSQTRASATDSQGNVFVTGYFAGQATFGSTTLSSVGDYDLFVAKYVPATGTWAWAQRGGGTGPDYGYGVAVSGTSVYVAGSLFNDAANASGVLFGGASLSTSTVAQYGASATPSQDLVLAKYTDSGTSAALSWTQVGGGTSDDYGYGVAASSSRVYVTGLLTNSSTNTEAVVFGGAGTTAGTASQYGASATSSGDLVLAQYTDNGPTATLGWTHVGGGTGNDGGYGVVVSGANVYVAGYLLNNAANTNGVLLGGHGTAAGTLPQYGASAIASSDLLLVKYLDAGNGATLGWAQVGGGTGADYGQGVAVSGTSVYVTGAIFNSLSNASAVLFGGAGTTAGTVPQYGASASSSSDVVVAKYIDNGPSATLGWTQVGGGSAADVGYGIAASGASVYVAGVAFNSLANANTVTFGGGSTTAGTTPLAGATATASPDLLVAKYLDNGPTATLGWAQVGGGAGTDIGYGLAVSGQRIYAAGYVSPTAAFGTFAIASPTASTTTLLARLTDLTLTPLALAPASASTVLKLYPNPAPGGTATLTGVAAGQAVQVLDALGRLVLTATADATGTAALAWPAGLPGGVYVVRAGAQALRLAVE